MSEEGANPFLEHLPSNTPVYRYDRQCDIESLLPPYSVEDRFIVLKHFPPETFAECEEELPQRCDYSPPLQILIITMPSLPHEEAAESFASIITILAEEMKVYRRLRNWGSTRIDTPDRSKQADKAWGPVHPIREFPTVALEVSFSETTAKLEKDIAWWINESRGDVRIGVTIDIKRESGSIEIKFWTPPVIPSPKHIYITANNRCIVDRNIDNSPRTTQRVFMKRGKAGSSPTIEGGGPNYTIPCSSVGSTG